MALPNDRQIATMNEYDTLDMIDRMLAQVNFPLSHDDDLEEARRLIAAKKLALTVKGIGSDPVMNGHRVVGVVA